MRGRTRRDYDALENAAETDVPEDFEGWSYTDYRNELVWLLGYYTHRQSPPVHYSNFTSAVTGGPLRTGELDGRASLERAIHRLEVRHEDFGKDDFNTRPNRAKPDVEVQLAAEQRALRLVRALRTAGGIEYRWFDATYDYGSHERTYDAALCVALYPLTASTTAVAVEHRNYASMTVSVRRTVAFTTKPEDKVAALREDLPYDYVERDVPGPVTPEAEVYPPAGADGGADADRDAEGATGGGD